MAKTPKQFQNSHDPLFTILSQEVTAAIARDKDGKSQKVQYEELIDAETQFKEVLLTYKVHKEIYKKFIALIRVQNNNILSARPYFREKSETFSKGITPALKSKNPEGLTPYAINYHFIRFCKDKWIGVWPKKLEQAYQRAEKARNVLVNRNTPLAINRAKIFYRKVPKGHLSFMDLIQVSFIGLCEAIDKYTGPYLANFAGVIIGRAVGRLIDLYSETQIHFYPGERRILYRANSIRGRQGIHDPVELAKAVNDSFALDLREGRTAPKTITPHELAELMAASSMVSSDSNAGEEGFGVYQIMPDSGDDPEETLGKKQQTDQISEIARTLPIINRKVLRLKGIEF